MTRWFVFLAAIALPSAALGQEVIEEEPMDLEADTIPSCPELDVDGEEELLAIDDAGTAFFEDIFDCDANRLRAETRMAPLLRALDEPQFVKTSEIRPERIALRETASHDRGFTVTRIECPIVVEDGQPQTSSNQVVGGTVSVSRVNAYAPEDDGRYTLPLGAADCQFLLRMSDEFDPHIVERNPPYDMNGPIILHGTSRLFESMDEYGRYAAYYRSGITAYERDEDTRLVESTLSSLLDYFRARAMESGSRSALP